MRIDLTARDQLGRGRDLAVIGPAGSTLGDARAKVSALLGCDCATEWFSAGRRLPPAARFGEPGLRTGDVVKLGTPDDDAPAGATLRLHVIGGPDAGRMVPLARGLLTAGRAADCDLVLTDPDVSRRHVSIAVTTGGVTVRDLQSTNGTSVDGVDVDEDGLALTPGDVLRLGDSFLSVRRPDEPSATLRATPEGVLLLNRPPRAPAPATPDEITFPVRDRGGRAQRPQWIAAVVPALVGVGLAVALHSVQFLVFALLTPVVVLTTTFGDRLHWHRSHKRAVLGWRRHEASAQAEATAALAAETAWRRREQPDPPRLHDIATGPGSRLWERRRTDGDALCVRLGLTELPSTVRARRGASSAPAGLVRDVPLCVDLRLGPLGIAAPAAIGPGIARWVLCQLAVLHPPADVEVALLLSDAADSAWLWARWLPHLTRRPAATPDERKALLAELGGLVKRRRAHRPHPAGWAGPWLVLVIDRVSALCDLPGLAAVLAAGPAVGITAICLDVRGRQLPAVCATSAVAAGETGSRLDLSAPGGVERIGAVADRVSAPWAESVARAIAPVADAGGEANAALPHQCRLVDLLGVGELGPVAAAERWRCSDGGAGTVLGIGADGPVHVDLVRDGPHALVAGTTGAGKSELLQSLVAGLAVNYPPEAMTFVLVDYKGGAAFADCARLPHTVGLVTDLDARLTERALRSLHCELSRREAMFAQAGAVDLGAYRAVAPPGAELARLVIVVDEFAALADDLPDFVDGLIAIAQRGRSLGVHLVLATQRPGGVVSPEIRANTTLRIALRMSDPVESLDVIGTERAAQLGRDTPGRAIVQLGSTSTELQTARVGGPTRSGASREISVMALDDWRATARPPARPSGGTDLQQVVEALRAAAASTTRPSTRPPWLAPLPDRLPAAQLPQAAGPTEIAFGLIDRPDHQDQPRLELDLATGGSLLFTGGPRSGRTTVLVTVALLAASRLDADELTIYTLDCAGGGLAPIAGLPHTATATTRDDVDLVATLVRRLESAVHRRQAWLAERGISSIADARAQGQRVPLLLCLLDGWDAFAAITEEHDSGRVVDTFTGLLRTAAAVGLTIVITGDRATLSARLAGAVATRFVLRLPDRADYSMAGIAPRAVPRDFPPGRGLRVADGAEVQLAYAGTAPSRAEQDRILEAIRGRERGGGRPRTDADFAPIRLRPLPARIALPQLAGAAGPVHHRRGRRRRRRARPRPVRRRGPIGGRGSAPLGTQHGAVHIARPGRTQSHRRCRRGPARYRSGSPRRHARHPRALARRACARCRPARSRTGAGTRGRQRGIPRHAGR